MKTVFYLILLSLSQAFAHCPKRLIAMGVQSFVVVDALSSAAEMGSLIKALGYIPVHVQSSPRLPKSFKKSFRPEDFFSGVMLVNDGKTDIIAELEKLNPVGILAGAESGTEYTDFLTYKMKKPGNKIENSSARRDKYVMQESLGIKKIPQFLAKDKASFYSGLAREGLVGKKLVIKPLKSSGAEGFHLVETAQQAEQALKSLLGKKDKYGNVIDQVLVQLFIEGTEFVINTVSHKGRHLVCDMWQYHKLLRDRKKGGGKASVYDYDELLPVNLTSPLQKLLVGFLLESLDDLGFENGPAHSELMLAKDGQVYLIETGGRFMGSNPQFVLRDVYNTSAMDLSLLAQMDPNKFEQEYGRYLLKHGEPMDHVNESNPFFTREHVRVIQLISDYAGKVTGYTPYFDRLNSEEIPSFKRCFLSSQKGDFLSRTEDLGSSPGVIQLKHRSLEQTEHDMQLIRSLEKKGFFKVKRPWWRLW